jgi:hypothetical protein
MMLNAGTKVLSKITSAPTLPYLTYDDDKGSEVRVKPHVAVHSPICFQLPYNLY